MIPSCLSLPHVAFSFSFLKGMQGSDPLVILGKCFDQTLILGDVLLFTLQLPCCYLELLAFVPVSSLLAVILDIARAASTVATAASLAMIS
jgi:hypothetical protein